MYAAGAYMMLLHKSVKPTTKVPPAGHNPIPAHGGCAWLSRLSLRAERGLEHGSGDAQHQTQTTGCRYARWQQAISYTDQARVMDGAFGITSHGFTAMVEVAESVSDDQVVRQHAVHL